MDYDYWFYINHWYSHTQLDANGDQFKELCSPDWGHVEHTQQVLSGPAPAPEQTVYSKDDIPF